jgi:hypothetical protein
MSGALNADLSQRRSASVRRALVDRFHIDPARLATSGYGASQPKDSLLRGHSVDGRCWAVCVRASCERPRRQGNRLHPERLPHRVLDPVRHISLLLDVGVLVVGARDTSDLMVEQPVVPVRAKLGVDPVHVLFSELFLLLAVPLDVLGGQHERRTVTDCDGRVPGRPDAIARGPQVHLGVAPQLGADQTSPRQASPPPPTTTGARGRRSSSRWGGRAPRGRWVCCRSIRRCAATA